MTEIKVGDKVRDKRGAIWTVDGFFRSRLSRVEMASLTCVSPADGMLGQWEGKRGQRPVAVLEVIR